MANISHGRGGAGNIAPDGQEYTDGGVTREGPVGDQGDGPYSTGRGGAGNVGSPRTAASKANDSDHVPDVNLREDRKEDLHFGRGGAGNVIHEEAKPRKSGEHKESLVDKIKDKLHK